MPQLDLGFQPLSRNPHGSGSIRSGLFPSLLWALLLVWAIAGVKLAARDDAIPAITISRPSALDPAAQSWISALVSQSAAPTARPTSLSVRGGETITWQRFDLSTTQALAGNDLWLTVDATIERRLDAFLVINGTLLDATAAGYAAPVADRKIAVNDLALPLKRWTGGEAFVYLRRESLSSQPLSPQIRSTLDLVEQNYRVVALDFACFGTFALVILIRAILFARFREPASRDYLILTIGLLIGVTARAGYWDLFIAPRLHLPLLGDFRFLIRIANSILAWRCVHSFFELRQHAPHFSRVIRASTWLFLGVIVATCFIPRSAATGLSSLAQLHASILVLGACAFALWRKLPGSGATTIGWALILISTAIVSFMAIGLLPAVGQEVATRLSVLALLWESIVNTATLTFRFSRLQTAEHLSVMRQQQAIYRQQLLRLLSHDILNPTAVIGNAVWLLRRGAVHHNDTLRHDPIEMIDQAVLEIREITRRVRDLEINAGRKIQLEPVNVVSAVEAAIDSLSHRAQAKNVTITPRFESTTALAWGEARLLTSSVVSNALSNAIKFSHREGKVEVSVTASRHAVIITIEDYGIGIPPEDRKALETLDGLLASRPGTQSEEGTGFGVQIMSHVTREMGGTLTIHSRTAAEDNGQSGTRVVISLRSAAP